LTYLTKGGTISICGKEYALTERLSGGFQFRTWLAERKGKRFVAKVTSDSTMLLRELRAYVLLRALKFPNRYYSRLAAVDYEARHKRKSGRNGRKYCALLLKYYQYHNLRKFLKKAKPREKLLVATKLKRRIQTLHRLGLCHGDLREENIIVTDRKRGIGVRLIDFGLSSVATERLVARENKKLDSLIARLEV
jgi:serine/threonine protein kinase